MAQEIMMEHYGVYVKKEHIETFLEKNQSIPAIQEQLQKGYHYELIYFKDKLAGYVGVIAENKQVTLSKLYIYERMRGNGIGAFILEWLENYTKLVGMNKMELMVHQQNKKGIQFYERAGFQISDIYEIKYETGGGEMNFMMTKNLN